MDEWMGEAGFVLVSVALLLFVAREIRWQMREKKLRETASRVSVRTAKRETAGTMFRRLN